MKMQVLQWIYKNMKKRQQNNKKKQTFQTAVENIQFILYYLLIICTVPCKIPTGVPR